MMELTEEQLRRIEQNKAAALLRKQQAMQRSKNASCNSNPTGSSGKEKVFEHELRKFPAKGDFEIKNGGGAVTAVCRVFGDCRFVVDMPYHESTVEMFKTINGRRYENDMRKWSFPLSEHSTVVSKLKAVNSDIVVNAIPDTVVRVLLEPDLPDLHAVNWNKIDKTLRDYLLPFQIDGIKFGIEKNGRCLIADDMGLGKTIQALGIAHYFKENWPLLIVCPSSMRFPWQDAIKKFLPSIHDVKVLTATKDQTLDGSVLILSYELMKNCIESLLRRQFRAIIFDESHLLKNNKSYRTAVALELANVAKNVILLSGTPALSRPQELYPQIYAVDPYTFRRFFDFGLRYCDGKREKYGWNFTGSSNSEELEMYLKKRIMIRRLKSEVIKQLPSKIRKVVILHPEIVNTVTKQIEKLDSDYTNQKGSEKHSTLLSYYALTGDAKLKAVCEYIEEKLECDNKFLIFAHHNKVLNGICQLLFKKSVDFIRIDGGISSELRKKYCDRFQTVESCRVAVLSIKAANCGITLTAAQLVIFAELYWNPGELTQAEDRAHRIGQQDSVLVEYLIAKGTADEHLWKLIEKKLNILNKVGLSKDSFKGTETKVLGDPHQPKISSIFPTVEKSPSSLVREKETLKVDDIKIPEGEDDIFRNINLEQIEQEYQISKKKRRIWEY